MFQRILLSILFLSCIIQPTKACSCFETSYCTYIDFYTDDPTLLIFKGSYLQSVQLDGLNKAVQFKVEKIYRGEVVTPSSPFYEGEQVTNTDSTVWLLEGSDVSCLRTFSQSDAIFIIPYKPGQFFSEEFSYVPSICNHDYFPISEEKTITGSIGNSSESMTIPVSDFENIILQDCGDLIDIDDGLTKSNCLNLYPNPTNGILNIEFFQESKEWSADIYNYLGQRISKITKNTIDINEYENGMYIIVFSIEGVKEKKIKKVIKV